MDFISLDKENNINETGTSEAAYNKVKNDCERAELRLIYLYL